MLTTLKEIVRRTPLRHLWHRYLATKKPRSQSDEITILEGIVRDVAVPRTFVEFGFHPLEFNCAGLLGRFDGLLLDGNPETVALAKRILPPRIQLVARLLTTENLDPIFDYANGRGLGVLSVDVDGNDYWFLEKLISLRPGIIIAEYNASLGLRPLSVPYDPAFERHAKHQSGWYHGASLSAMDHLCRQHGYDLVAVTSAGANGFWVRHDLRESEAPLAVDAGYRENLLRNKWSGTRADQQWERIKHLPFVDVAARPRVA